MHHFDYRNGVLHAEDVPLPDIAREVGTPFYCYSTATLERHYHVFADAFAGMDTLICYAMKANSNQAVLTTLARLGSGADVVSGGELRRALAAGIPAGKIVFSGVGKTDAELSLALDSGARVMLYAMRNADGSAHVSGTWIDTESTPHPLAPGDISMRPVGYSQVAGREIPTAWHLEVPRFELAVDTEPLNAHSWMDTSFAYWEGPIRLSGSHAGRGYLEMTGYE